MLLHKYLNFQQFVGMVECQRLYLTNLPKWDDPYEGFPIRELALPPAIRDSISPELKDAFTSSNLENIYAQSWNQGEESDALWRIYSNLFGVRITVESDRIKKQIDLMLTLLKIPGFTADKVNHYPVIYGATFDSSRCDKGDGVYEMDDATACEQKREAFLHEKEYRFSLRLRPDFKDTPPTNSDEDMIKMLGRRGPPVIYYDFPIDALGEVILDPRAPDYFEEIFSQYCANRNFKDKNVLFRKSNLYQL